ncbi:MAG TPA: acetylxylan esterase [Pedobacter sp.]|jgi:cephalosporin-C deacetylase-like acetyl esterase
MKMINCVTYLLLLCISVSAQKKSDKQLSLHAFSYDKKAPLKLRDSLIKEEDGIKHFRISYISTQNDRATGIMFVPTRKGPFAGVILQHGMPSSAEAYSSRATYIAKHGAIVLAIDAPFARHKTAGITFTPQDSVEQVQLIIDLQRAVDLLIARPDVDKDRLAFVGRSFGGVMGVLFAGVERRVKSYLLSVCDGGQIIHFGGEDSMGEVFRSLSAGEQKRWLTAMEPIEPIKYIHRATPANFSFSSALMITLLA